SNSDSRTEFIEKLPARLELSSDGKLLKVTTAVPGDLGPQPSDVETALPLVPLAEVRILAIDNKKKELVADASTAIGITYPLAGDRKSTRLNSSHQIISYAVFCLKKK